MLSQDEDIIREHGAVWWALSYRCNQAIDVQIMPHPRQGPWHAILRKGRRGRLHLFDGLFFF